MSDDEFFQVARGLLASSTCLKTATAAIIVKNDEALSVGWNLCAPAGHHHGNTVSACPRMSASTGTDYELCKPLHAEVMACLNIRPGRDPGELARFASHIEPSSEEIRKAFTAAERATLTGATLYLVGHYWACDGCIKFTQTVGITDIRFDALTANTVRNRYSEDGLT